MNLRVDLILDGEKRSASIVNLKSIVRILAIVGPLIIIVCASLFAVGMLNLKKDLKSKEDQLAADAPVKQKALDLRAELNVNLDILDELESWRGARMSLSEQLTVVQKNVSDRMQLQNVTLLQSILPTNNVLARCYSMSLAGKIIAESADFHARTFEQTLQREPALEMARIVRFDKPLNQAESNSVERVFTVECRFKPKAFAPETAKK